MMNTEYIFIVMPDGCRKSDNTLEPYFLKLNKLENNSEEVTWVNNLSDATAFIEDEEFIVAGLLLSLRNQGFTVRTARVDKILFGKNINRY